MTTADPETRIADLKARWEAEPSSRIFVQLADEYRRAGNTAEAIEVLTKGLASQPNYVTAQAALGRCHLAAGDAGSAIEVLTRVMEQDPSHPLAGKLLVEAHLQTGDLDEANKRLEHYRMVADSGPEIEDLEERLETARSEQSAEAQAPALAAEPPAASAAEEDVFNLGSVELSIPSDDPFDLPAPTETASLPEAAAVPESAPVSDDPFQLGPPPEVATRVPGPVGEDEPFGDLLGAPDLDRWSQDLDREGIFRLEGVEDRVTSRLEPGLEDDLVQDFSPEDLELDESELDEDAKSEEATVTLGQLYMAQGHRQEAAKIFRKVLERDPDNAVSRRALAELEGVGSPAEPAPSLPASPSEPERESLLEPESKPVPVPTPVPEHPEPVEGLQDVAAPVATAQGITERKISALEDYLHRLRQAAQA